MTFQNNDGGMNEQPLFKFLHITEKIFYFQILKKPLMGGRESRHTCFYISETKSSESSSAPEL